MGNLELKWVCVHMCVCVRMDVCARARARAQMYKKRWELNKKQA